MTYLLIACSGSAIAGLAVGYAVGRFAARLQAEPSEESSVPDRNSMHPNLWRWLLIGMSLVLVVVGFEVYRQNDCQQSYAQASAAAQKARTDATEKRDVAVDEVFMSVIAASQTDASDEDRQRFRDALVNYQRTSTDLNQARKENPYPAFPAEFCRESR